MGPIMFSVWLTISSLGSYFLGKSGLLSTWGGLKPAEPQPVISTTSLVLLVTLGFIGLAYFKQIKGLFK